MSPERSPKSSVVISEKQTQEPPKKRRRPTKVKEDAPSAKKKATKTDFKSPVLASKKTAVVKKIVTKRVFLTMRGENNLVPIYNHLCELNDSIDTINNSIYNVVRGMCALSKT